MSRPIELARAVSTRRTKRAFLVLHGGDVQEQYLHWLKRALAHSQISLQLLPPDVTAIDAVRIAVRARREAKSKGSAYDEVWCLLDICPDEVEVNTLAEKGGVQVAWQSPSFELWVLLHFSGDLSGTEDQSAIKARLHEHLPTLTDNPRDSLELLSGRYDQAAKRAIRLPPPHRSEAYRLVESVRDSLRLFQGVEKTDLP